MIAKLQKDQLICCFKFDVSKEAIDVKRYFLKVEDIQEFSSKDETCLKYKVNCLEDYDIEFNDNRFISFEEFEFETVKFYDGYYLVLLEEDDIETARYLVQLAIFRIIEFKRNELGKLFDDFSNILTSF